MRALRLPLAPLLVFALVACDSSGPTSPGSGSSTTSFAGEAQAAHGEADCYAVSGTITESLTGPNSAAGVISGDLEGSINIVINFGSATGNVVHFTAQHTIDITGGPEAIVGSTLTTSDRGVQLGQPPVFRINNLIDITDGGDGHLTTHGTLDVSAPSDQVQLGYHGVVCS